MIVLKRTESPSPNRTKSDWQRVYQCHSPQPNFAADVSCWEEALRPERQMAAAGSNQGGHWTPFRQTCLNLVDFITENGPTMLSDAVRVIEHPYKRDATATQTLRQFIDARTIPVLQCLEFDPEAKRHLSLVRLRKGRR